MKFRAFADADEERLAGNIIAGIDRGERWIFEGAEAAAAFGGFLDRLFYRDNSAYGTFCSCVFDGELHLQIGFKPDMPLALQNELLLLIRNARERINTAASIWYSPENTKLHEFIFNHLPWKARGRKTYELAFLRSQVVATDIVPRKGISIVPFEEKHLAPVCAIFDRSLAHTFDKPGDAEFSNNKEKRLPDWLEKAKNRDCCVLLENGSVTGAYVLKGAEIDIMAVAVERQGEGLGRLLLYHAKEHIISTTTDDPYLYCVAANHDALRFYMREGMQCTGYSGYALLEPV